MTLTKQRAIRQGSIILLLPDQGREFKVYKEREEKKGKKKGKKESEKGKKEKEKKKRG